MTVFHLWDSVATGHGYLVGTYDNFDKATAAKDALFAKYVGRKEYWSVDENDALCLVNGFGEPLDESLVISEDEVL